MPILIRDYIAEQLPSVWSPEELSRKTIILEKLLNKMFLHSPSNLDTQSSPYFSKTYKDEQNIHTHENSLLMTWIMEKIFHPVSLTSTNQQARQSFWGEIATPETPSQILYAIYCALAFAHTGLGNCAKRAAYAALELHKTLTNTGLQIKLQSWTEIDHFTVHIGNNEKGWKIYDPLTNPELIFDLNEYEQEIKPLFKRVLQPKLPVELIINERIRAQFNFQLAKKSPPFFAKALQETTLDALKHDENYAAFLQLSNILDPGYKKTERAYNQLRQIFQISPLSANDAISPSPIIR